MTSAAAPTHGRARGIDLLLEHCAAVASDRPSADERLEALLGAELARMLVRALGQPRARRRL